jgi:enoyl-CoA hydratase/carnithine racemase
MMALPTHQYLEVHQEEKVLWVAFNNSEKMNCLGDDMLDVFCQIVDAVEDDDSVSVVVVRGKGSCFSSGFDISRRDGRKRPENAEASRRFYKRRYAFISKVWSSAKPFIASVHSYCLAGASDLSNACDITLASDDAVFGYPAVRWGGHTHALTYPWNMPIKKAKELMFTGDRISADEALQLGMVNRVVPRADLENSTRDLAKRISMTPLSGLIVNKISLNYSYQVRGYKEAAQYAFQIAETNRWRQNKTEFEEKVLDGGLRSALDWRDKKYGDRAP